MILKIVKIITLLCLHKILKYCTNTVYYVIGRYMLRRNYTVDNCRVTWQLYLNKEKILSGANAQRT